MKAMSELLIVLFGYTTPYPVAVTALYIIGLWGLLRKSGLYGRWAAIPCAREYMLAKCAGREPEGRVACTVNLLSIIVQGAEHYIGIPEEAAKMTGVDIALVILRSVLQIISTPALQRFTEGVIVGFGCGSSRNSFRL